MNFRSGNIAKAAAITVFAALMIALRRPDQILQPEVWNEDGLFVIPQILQHGISAVFEPVNGYLIIPSRLITWIALTISFEHYPAISTWLGVLAQAACVCVVAIAPTMLRTRTACALALLFLPMNAEVYALPQYTFWWTTLFLFLALVWQEGKAPFGRNVLTVIGGFSSPMGIALAPLFAVRAVVTKSRADLITFAVVATVSAVQLYFVIAGDPTQTQKIGLTEMVFAVKVFFSGWSIAWGHLVAMPFAVAVCLLLAFGIRDTSRESRMAYILLGLALGASIASSMLRVPIEVASPTGNGPRYFYLPIVLIAWMLIWLASSRKILTTGCAMVVLISAIPVTWENFQRRQEHLRPWADAVRECRDHGADMPVHHNGDRALDHKAPYSQEACRAAN